METPTKYAFEYLIHDDNAVTKRGEVMARDAAHARDLVIQGNEGLDLDVVQILVRPFR